MQASHGFAIAPLPPGWTEHRAPTGHAYYYNSFTKESTYIRPPSFAAGVSIAPVVQTSEMKGKGSKKFKSKTQVAGTPWLRVVTTSGDVFYTHKEKKESVWTVPEEIRDAVASLESEEAKIKTQSPSRLTGDERPDISGNPKTEGSAAPKRRVSERSEAAFETSSKKARVEDDDEDEDEDETSDGEEEEEWQREAAAQLAAEAEEAERMKQEIEKREHEEQEELKRKEKERGNLAISMPNRVDISIEEGKALFKTLLREKDINPLLPWDTALPQFISDPRYVLLPSVAARRDAFDEYCRDRARELREAKIANSAASSEHKDPKAEFERLLREEVKSTRTSWSDWRRTWKKDRRFYGWGRDDRERERKFKEWLKELGEQKRKAAEKAEADFFALLKEKADIGENAIWKEIKRGLDKDKRYDAVGSSSLREELFNTYLKMLSSGVATTQNPVSSNGGGPSASKPLSKDEKDTNKRDRERKERAVREREDKVRREKERLDVENARSRKELSREEDELQFLNLLTDAIRDPTATWESALSELKTDPRFLLSALSNSQQQALFRKHISALRTKQLAALHALFAAHATGLQTRFSDLPTASIRTSFPAQKLGLDNNSDALRSEYEDWARARAIQAERDFQEMLYENAFVEFWGRVRKMQESGDGGMKVEVNDEDLAGEERGDDDREQADLKTLARSVDVQEIERVLKNDRRYTLFDHDPQLRGRWIRAHVEKLAAPKLSVHVPETSR